MFELVVQFVIAPVLVGAASLAARWWGHGIGGLVSAFPAIVGPVLLVGAHRHGASFAAQQATHTPRPGRASSRRSLTSATAERPPRSFSGAY